MSSVEEKQRLLVEMVMRQTNYTFEEAEINLVKNNNDYMKVIREALGTKSSSNKGYSLHGSSFIFFHQDVLSVK